MKHYLLLLLVLISVGFSSIAGAENIDGIDGYNTFDYSPYNTMDMNEWPEDYKELCDQHMRAVIKKCAESGYENWTVKRNYTANKFSPVRGYVGAEDMIVGNYSCGYGANTIDEILVSTAILNFMCSENDFESDLKSEQYSCSFSCQAWDCDEDVGPNDIYVCSTNNKLIPDVDPFEQVPIGCQQDAEKVCKSRGTWWKLKFCKLEKPCEFKSKGGSDGHVYCECSCPEEEIPSNISESDLARVLAEDFDIDGFNFENWERDNSCYKDVVISNQTDNTSSTQGDGVSSVPDSVKQNILDNSTLAFSDNAGQIASDPVSSNQSIIGTPSTHNANDITTAINDSTPGAAALLGAQTGRGAAQALDTYNAINPPTVDNSVARDTVPFTNLDNYGGPAEDATPPAPEPDSTDLSCDETTCGEWGAFSWEFCQPEGEKIATRTRTCESVACETEDTKTQNCNYTPPEITLIVDGVVAIGDSVECTSCSVDIKLEYNEGHPLDMPITISVSEPQDNDFTPIVIDDAVAWGCESESVCTVSNASGLQGYITSVSAGTSVILGVAIGENSEWSTTLISIIPFTSDANPACTESWSCGEYDSCSSGTQTRTCTDSNACGTTTDKPSESQGCETACTPDWSCGDYGSWGSWDACSQAGSQSRSRTRTCTDANSCGTSSGKPDESESESQSCEFDPSSLHQKDEYTAHLSSLGANVGSLSYSGASTSVDLSATGGTYGYTISDIPAANTLKICAMVTAGTDELHFNVYPQYPMGYDWSTLEWETANSGCITMYNKNAYANGALLHLGDPDPANDTVNVTVENITQ